MIMDSRTEFADAVALNTGAAGGYLIGSQIDIGSIKDIGRGRPLFLVILIDTAVTSGGSATVEFQLRSDDSAAVHISTSTLHLSTGAIPKATLVAGYKLVFALPSGIDYERYLGIVQVTGTAAVTAGKVNAFLTLDPPGWKAEADALR